MPAKKDLKKIIFKKSIELKVLDEIKGPSFEKKPSLDEFLTSYDSVGFQASNTGKAIKIIKQMKKDKATVYFGFTSNIVSSGLRDIITLMAKKKLVDAFVTTAGGIEEDIIKAHKPFLLGSFDADNAGLRRKGVNRIGNILVPNERYIWFESFLQPLLKKLFEKQKTTGMAVHSIGFCRALAREMDEKKIKNKEESFIYQAVKNNIPVICPSIIDGAIGDNVFFFKQDNPSFQIDVTSDKVFLDSITLNAKKLGVIILGGGLAKHFILNSALMREGFDYAVYVSTAVPDDGSLSGAQPEEALSWGKGRKESNFVNVYCDATIAFPLIAAGAFL